MFDDLLTYFRDFSIFLTFFQCFLIFRVRNRLDLAEISIFAVRMAQNDGNSATITARIFGSRSANYFSIGRFLAEKCKLFFDRAFLLIGEGQPGSRLFFKSSARAKQVFGRQQSIIF